MVNIDDLPMDVDIDTLPLDWRLEIRYQYKPSIAAAGVFFGLFFLTTGTHTFQLIKSRSWYFLPFFVGGLFEVFGFLFRTIDIHVGKQPSYILQLLLILLAPALYAASIYMILKRLTRVVDAESYALIPARWLTVFFVGGDVVSFLLQAAGGGILASVNSDDDDKLHLGNNLVIGGLWVQLIVFGLFFLTTIIFHIRIQRKPTPRSTTVQVPWLRYIYILYVAGVLILVRSVFRTAEYMQGHDGYLIRHEVYFYVLDATLMFLLSVLLNIFHPSTVISRDVRSKSLDSMDVEDVQMGETGAPVVNHSSGSTWAPVGPHTS